MKTSNDKITQLQGRLAVASFSVGSIIALGCLFLVPPPGEITNSAITLTSEFLVLAGALLGIKVSMDAKLQKFMTEIKGRQDEKPEEHED